MWATDGTIAVRPPPARGGSHITFSTNSRTLALDVAALLLRLRVHSRIRTTEQRTGRPLFAVTIYGVADQQRFLQVVGTFGPRREQAKRLLAAIDGVRSNTNVDTLPIECFDRVRASMRARGISHREMSALRGTSYGGSSHFHFAPSRLLLAEYAEILEDDALMAHATSDLFWDRVVAVESAGEEDVFDLTVPGPASWLADGIVSHNSGALEQDADVVVFVYRDEVYNPDTPKKGEAEIIVAKHRNGPTETVNLAFLGQYTKFENLART
jgi:replicative DNA helicase